jgi:hypothetical protein
MVIFLQLILSVTGCGLVETPRDCRDNVIEKVPIYPNSHLVSEDLNSTSNDLNWGSLRRSYETSDSVGDVMSYYGAFAGCTIYPPLECGGYADGDERIHYTVNIAEDSETVTFSIFFDWMCKRGQF